MQARQLYQRRRNMARLMPTEFASVIIDGMDQVIRPL